MTPREQTEAIEVETLSPLAAHAARSRGRARPEEPDTYRTAFQRDRDRLLHCKAFRRLAHKTQVFIAPEGDHYRTRLTHSLEVSQIARTISRALRLNEDLTEAIAYGHDLGHTPFGHTGEDALNAVYRSYDAAARFRHFEQSVRIVVVLENEGAGLNLTAEVLDGIGKHSKGKADLQAALEGEKELPATLEGQVVMWADRIAYLNHDLDDAVRADLLSTDDIPAPIRDALGRTSRERLARVVGDCIETSAALMQESAPHIALNHGLVTLLDDLKEFMFERVYLPRNEEQRERVDEVIRTLFHLYMETPDRLPGWLYALGQRAGYPRAVCDYIAGMTDRFASQQYELLLAA